MSRDINLAGPSYNMSTIPLKTSPKPASPVIYQ